MCSGDGRSFRDRLVAHEITARGKDGAVYRMRPIRPSDAASLMRGYDALSERSKWFRMLYAVPHLTDEMALRFCSPDPASEACVVVEGRRALDGEILGGARVADLGPGRAAEFAVSLRPEARGLSLARQALEAAIEIARESGCASVWGSIASENEEMRHLAKRLGFTTRRDPDDGSLLLATLSLARDDDPRA